MKKIDSLLDEYGETHQDPTNKAIHLVAVPLIVISALGLLWCIPSPLSDVSPFLNWTLPVVIFALVFYLRLSYAMFLGMLLFSALSLWGIHWVEPLLPRSLLEVSFMVFATSWIFQFLGHKVEGKKPAFFKDLQFLFVGPLWVLRAIYRKIGIPY